MIALLLGNWRLVAAAVALAASFGAGVRVEAWRWEAADAARFQREIAAQTAAQELARMNQLRADGAATKGEHESEKIKNQFQVITETVDRIVEKPVYRNVCFDTDGMLELAKAIGAPAAAGAASQPGGAVPGSAGSK